MATVFREYPVDFWSVGALPLGVLLAVVIGIIIPGYSPAMAINRLVERAEAGLRTAVVRKRGGPRAELLAGLVLSLVVVGLVAGSAWLAVVILGQIGGLTTLIGRTLLTAAGLAFGRTGREAVAASEANDLATARRWSAGFAGLDSSRLDTTGIRQAGVRSVGERANRRLIAPSFWLAIGGPAGLWGYQAVDALGRRFANGGTRNRYFGFASSRLDDLANFVPERLTWLLVALAAALLGEDGGQALRAGAGLARRQPTRPGACGQVALDAALGLDEASQSTPTAIEASTVRRAVQIIRVAGLHAAAFALAYRIVVMGR